MVDIAKIMKDTTDKLGRVDYVKIATEICSNDYDQDGIPDCIESPKGECTDSETKLKFHSADSDGDGLIDGMGLGVQAGEKRDWDVCPVTKGEAWEIVAVPDIRRQVWHLARYLEKRWGKGL